MAPWRAEVFAESAQQLEVYSPFIARFIEIEKGLSVAAKKSKVVCFFVLCVCVCVCVRDCVIVPFRACPTTCA